MSTTSSAGRPAPAPAPAAARARRRPAPATATTPSDAAAQAGRRRDHRADRWPRPPPSRPPASPARRAWSARSRPWASRSSSASPAGRSSRPTTRSSTPRCGTCWSATSRAPGTPRRGTPRPPARSASAWPPPDRARPTWSPRWPTPTWTRSRSWRSPARCPAAAIGTDAFQEADIRGITMPVTKHNFLVTDADEIPQRIAEAFHLATTGRPGPVLVDIPKDVLQATHRLRLAAADRPARLQADHPPARQAGPRGGRADRRRAAVPSSTSGAACSRPAPPRSSPSWPR